ncbi:protein DA1-like isoform X2 [Andrographis paniculata]|uniref:protein DA1-like isoform X2 n=1 Tax=Andrographis paniculata TaxID=175694 RepID=UPI0021E927D5|nr:protein DA1-like isoform X2 [Andrographis paniculata]
MGWLSKIFKGLRHKSVEERYDWRSGTTTDTSENHPSTSWNSSKEFEEIDCAIALSLSEEDLKKNVVIDREPQQVEDDERLARALQESLIIESQPGPSSNNGYSFGNGYGYSHGSDYLYQPLNIPYPSNFRICAGCNREIGHGRFLNCMSAIWHPECFRCHGCNQPISDYEFSVFGGYAYHKTCYKESHHPKCDVCRQFIPVNRAGLIEYRAHPFWSQKYCPRHDQDGTPRCCSCERMESWDTRFAPLNDGRKLCLECLDSAIMGTKECQPLFNDIQRFFEVLNMKLMQKVPLFLVEKHALNEVMGVERHGHHHTPETRGVCLTEERNDNTQQQQQQQWRIGAEPFALGRHCEVTAIIILFGLPRLLTGTILAHEMTHAWLRLNGYRGLREDVEEGMCQVIASMWLESQILLSEHDSNGTTSSSSMPERSSFERSLSKFFKHQMATDSSPVYGNGFRAGHRAVVKFGLDRTLDHIRRTGNFPY